MALVECAKCGGKVSTHLPKCPKCGEPQQRARVSAPVSRSSPENVGWAKTWAIAGGCFLLAGFMIPIPIPQYNGFAALWSWDIVAHAPVSIAIGMVAPPVAGLAILAVAAFAPSRLLAPIMACVGGAIVGLELLLLLIQGASIDEKLTLRIPLPLLAGALAFAGAFGIAAGNHIRKKYPDHSWPRLVMGICGILVVVFFLLPLGGRPIVAGFFEATAWKEAWPVTLGLLACLEYGIAGILGFKTFANPRKASAVLSVLGGVTFVLFPVSFVILWLVQVPAEFRTIQGLAPAALAVLKVFLSVYGLLILPWAGIAATVIGTLKRETPATAIPPVPSPIDA